MGAHWQQRSPSRPSGPSSPMRAPRQKHPVGSGPVPMASSVSSQMLLGTVSPAVASTRSKSGPTAPSGSPTGAGPSLEILPDGSVWRVERTPEGTGRLATWTGEEWASVSAPGLSTLLGRGPARYSFAITSDGPTWLGVDHGTGGGSARYENGRWQVVTPPGEDALRIHGLAARDDVLWVLAEVVADPSAKPATTVLLRHEADSWQTFGPSEGLPRGIRGPCGNDKPIRPHRADLIWPHPRPV